MKHLVIFFILFLGPVATAFGQDRIIEDHGFGVFIAAQDSENGRTVLFLHNSGCIGTYKVANGQVVIGEGKVDFRSEPVYDIPFGDKDLKVTCASGDRLRVVVR